MKMERKVLDALMLEMTHGTVEINSIPPPAPQDGLVMKLPTNVLWPSQEMDLVQELPANNTAATDQTHQEETNINVIPLPIPVISARRVMTQIAQQTEELPAITARTQIQLSSSSVTELTKTTHNANHAQRTLPLVACPKVKPVTVALHHQNLWNVIQRHSLVSLLRVEELSNKLVMPNVDTLPHKSFLVPGEV
jgi:hypothetical protein